MLLTLFLAVFLGSVILILIEGRASCFTVCKSLNSLAGGLGLEYECSSSMECSESELFPDFELFVGVLSGVNTGGSLQSSTSKQSAK